MHSSTGRTPRNPINGASRFANGRKPDDTLGAQDARNCESQLDVQAMKQFLRKRYDEAYARYQAQTRPDADKKSQSTFLYKPESFGKEPGLGKPLSSTKEDMILMIQQAVKVKTKSRPPAPPKVYSGHGKVKT